MVCNPLSTQSLQPYICSRFLQPSKIIDMHREKRAKRARQIAAALRLARVESTPEPSTQPPLAALDVTQSGGSGSTADLAAPQPLPIQPLTSQPPPTQTQPSQPPTTPHTVESSSSTIPSTQFFHDTYYRQKSNEWVNDVARQRHDALVQRTEEQSQSSVTSLMTEEQIDVDVLGKRSGYLKGYGTYTRTSSSSTQSRAPDSEVIALQEQLADQDRRLAERDRRLRALEALVRQLAAAAGIDPTDFFDITRGTTFAGDGTATGDHDATL